MSVAVVDPQSGAPLVRDGDCLTDGAAARYPIVSGVPRLAGYNYAANFGYQWNKFSRTQLDKEQVSISRDRFFAETGWRAEELAGKEVLEVGSGAGRFSQVVLEHTRANLWSIDYSEAVDANWINNSHLARDRFHLFQASIYDMPFADGSFDKVFCLGVLQHTPDFAKSVYCLVRKARPGGEIVVDFYPINGWWTKLHAKYILRPVTKRLSQERLLSLIEKNVDWLLGAYGLLKRLRLGVLTRFLPLAEISNFPPHLSASERREWAVLDTFDAFSPQYDQPQRVQDVADMFARAGAKVEFAGKVPYEHGTAAVVRAIRQDI